MGPGGPIGRPFSLENRHQKHAAEPRGFPYRRRVLFKGWGLGIGVGKGITSGTGSG